MIVDLYRVSFNDCHAGNENIGVIIYAHESYEFVLKLSSIFINRSWHT